MLRAELIQTGRHFRGAGYMPPAQGSLSLRTGRGGVACRVAGAGRSGRRGDIASIDQDLAPRSRPMIHGTRPSGSRPSKLATRIRFAARACSGAVLHGRASSDLAGVVPPPAGFPALQEVRGVTVRAVVGAQFAARHCGAVPALRCQRRDVQRPFSVQVTLGQHGGHDLDRAGRPPHSQRWWNHSTLCCVAVTSGSA